jgi:hypothetical protein
LVTLGNLPVNAQVIVHGDGWVRWAKALRTVVVAPPELPDVLDDFADDMVQDERCDLEREHRWQRDATRTLMHLTLLTHLDVVNAGELCADALCAVGTLTHLRSLRLVSNAPNLAPLRRLSALRLLRIETRWSHADTTVPPSFKPLGEPGVLPHLNVLELCPSRTWSGTTLSLGNMNGLASLRVFRWDNRCNGPPLSFASLQALYTLPHDQVDVRIMRIPRHSRRSPYLLSLSEANATQRRTQETALLKGIVARFRLGLRKCASGCIDSWHTMAQSNVSNVPSVATPDSYVRATDAPRFLHRLRGNDLCADCDANGAWRYECHACGRARVCERRTEA